MSNATATWKLWGNEVSLLRMGLSGTDAIAKISPVRGSITMIDPACACHSDTASASAISLSVNGRGGERADVPVRM